MSSDVASWKQISKHLMTESIITRCPCLLQRRRCWWVQLADSSFNSWPPRVTNFLLSSHLIIPFGRVQLLTPLSKYASLFQICLYQFTVVFIKIKHNFTGNSCSSNSAHHWKWRLHFSQSGKVDALTSPVISEKLSFPRVVFSAYRS